MKNTYILEL